MSAKLKICVITGTRAEYGLLKNLLKIFKESDEFELQLVVTGTHLSKKYGETYKEIESDGFYINKKIDLDITSDTPLALTRSASLGLLGFSEAFHQIKPDLILVLGDRFEILSAVIAAMFLKIPIVHLHGGELSEGSMDEGIRHSITKFSHLHFVANEIYKNRVIQLGENPKTVFNVGGLGVDAIQNLTLLNKSELEKSLGFVFLDKSLLVTFHPATLEGDSTYLQMSEILDALANLTNTTLIFTMPNIDMHSQGIFDLIEIFVSQHANAHSFQSLGQLRYLSCIAQVDAVLGNSSSGLTEVPSFKKPTINVGERQKGRIQACSVINCPPISSEIISAINKSYSNEFKAKLNKLENPYGSGGASRKIVDILSSVDFRDLIKKKFYDLKI